MRKLMLAAVLPAGLAGPRLLPSLLVAAVGLAAALALSACAAVGTGAGGAVTTQDKIMQAARATCAAWPIADAAFKGLSGSGLVVMPKDAAVWEGGLAAVVKANCEQVAAADAADKQLDITTLNGILTQVANNIMAVTDYVASLKHT